MAQLGLIGLAQNNGADYSSKEEFVPASGRTRIMVLAGDASPAMCRRIQGRHIRVLRSLLLLLLLR